jgi:hypothetical protein
MGVKIFMQDLRAAGVCKRSRDWFRSHGLDYGLLRRGKGGIDVDALFATGDQTAQVKLVEQAALAREARENG